MDKGQNPPGVSWSASTLAESIGCTKKTANLQTLFSTHWFQRLNTARNSAIINLKDDMKRRSTSFEHYQSGHSKCLFQNALLTEWIKPWDKMATACLICFGGHTQHPNNYRSPEVHATVSCVYGLLRAITDPYLTDIQAYMNLTEFIKRLTNYPSEGARHYRSKSQATRSNMGLMSWAWPLGPGPWASGRALGHGPRALGPEPRPLGLGTPHEWFGTAISFFLVFN